MIRRIQDLKTDMMKDKMPPGQKKIMKTFIQMKEVYCPKFACIFNLQLAQRLCRQLQTKKL